MFCGKCGQQVPEDANVCPFCGNVLKQAQPAYQQPVQPQYTQPSYTAQPQANYAVQQQNNAGGGAAGAALACGILSIVFAIAGAIMYGVIVALIAVVLGIVAIVLGVNAKKATNGAKGNGGLICGILGLVFGIIFAAGCGLSGIGMQAQGYDKPYSCYGALGGGCMMANDAKNYINRYYW